MKNDEIHVIETDFGNVNLLDDYPECAEVILSAVQKVRTQSGFDMRYKASKKASRAIQYIRASEQRKWLEGK